MFVSGKFVTFILQGKSPLVSNLFTGLTPLAVQTVLRLLRLHSGLQRKILIDCQQVQGKRLFIANRAVALVDHL